MDQERNLRSAWVTAIRQLAPLLWMLVLTNSTTQSMMCEGLFLDVTKISEPEGNEARARLGGSSASGPFSADAPSLPLPLRLSLVQFENQGCKNRDTMIVIIDIQNKTGKTVLFPATRDNSFGTSAAGNIEAALRLVVGGDKTTINSVLVLYGSSILPSSVVKIPSNQTLRIRAPLQIRVPNRAFMGNAQAMSFRAAVNFGFLRGPMHTFLDVESNIVDLDCRP